jgi:hypothetical protein
LRWYRRLHTVSEDSTGLTVTQTGDFLVTQAVIRDDGRLLATALTDMTRTASGIVPGGVFVTRTYTRRPDRSQWNRSVDFGRVRNPLIP